MYKDKLIGIIIIALGIGVLVFAFMLDGERTVVKPGLEVVQVDASVPAASRAPRSRAPRGRHPWRSHGHSSAGPTLASEEPLPGESETNLRVRRKARATFQLYLSEASLTDEQEQRLLRAILDASHNLRKAEDAATVPGLLGDALGAVRAEMETEVQGILTDEQYGLLRRRLASPIALAIPEHLVVEHE